MLFRHPACWVVLKSGAGLVAPHDGRPLSGGPGCSGRGQFASSAKVRETESGMKGTIHFT